MQTNLVALVLPAFMRRTSRGPMLNIRSATTYQYAFVAFTRPLPSGSPFSQGPPPGVDSLQEVSSMTFVVASANKPVRHVLPATTFYPLNQTSM